MEEKTERACTCPKCNEQFDRLETINAELLEALKRIAFEPFGPSDATHEQVLEAITELARAAIAKATAKP